MRWLELVFKVAKITVGDPTFRARITYLAPVSFALAGLDNASGPTRDSTNLRIVSAWSGANIENVMLRNVDDFPRPATSTCE